MLAITMLMTIVEMPMIMRMVKLVKRLRAGYAHDIFYHSRRRSPRKVPASALILLAAVARL